MNVSRNILNLIMYQSNNEIIKSESGCEPLNLENEFWKGGNYRDTQVFFSFIKNNE